MIHEKINKLIAEAMKEHNQERTETLRLIKAELVKAEKDGIEPTDSNEIKILSRMVTQRKDSIAQYEAAGRMDLVDSENKELAIIQEFIPALPSDEEIEKYAEKVVSEFKDAHGAVTMKDTRDILAKVKEEFDTPSTGKIVSAVIKRFV